jgi:ribosomal protein L19E
MHFAKLLKDAIFLKNSVRGCTLKDQVYKKTKKKSEGPQARIQHQMNTEGRQQLCGHKRGSEEPKERISEWISGVRIYRFLESRFQK